LKIAIKHFQIWGWYVWFRMICENCGARIGKKERYCPNCGREVFNSSEKPLQQKYLRGGYSSEEGSFQEPYQDWDDYDKDPYEAYHENDEIVGEYKDFDIAEKLCQRDKIYSPITENVNIYKKKTELLQKCYFALKNIFKEMSED
jgi:hypothetical protein